MNRMKKMTDKEFLFAMGRFTERVEKDPAMQSVLSDEDRYCLGNLLRGFWEDQVFTLLDVVEKDSGKLTPEEETKVWGAANV